MKTTYAAALAKINAAAADGIPAEWVSELEAVRQFFQTAPETVIDILKLTDLTVATLVKQHSGVKLSQEFCFTVIDIISSEN